MARVAILAHRVYVSFHYHAHDIFESFCVCVRHAEMTFNMGRMGVRTKFKFYFPGMSRCRFGIFIYPIHMNYTISNVQR